MRRSAILSAFVLTFGALGAMTPAGMANGWQPLTTQPPGNASTMFLLMDGRVLVNDWFTRKWLILTPDVNGSYVNGTWTSARRSQYDRLYYASSVLQDGRVIVSGGEYSNNGGSDQTEIYDPVTDKWTTIASPTGWGYIGDAPSVVLADGRFLMGNITDSRTAIYDPVTDLWTASASKLNSSSVEETWTLLPDGTVLSQDCVGHPHSQLYDPVLDTWVDLGNMPVDLIDSLLECGPGMLMYDGRAFVIGATPHSAHYTPAATRGGVGVWVPGGDPPSIGGGPVEATDAPASILPNGNVLCALGHDFNPPTYFFEYDGANFVRIVDPGNSGGIPYEGRMLPLPNGEVLFANVTIYVYTCDGGPDPSWLPTITSVATDLIPGESYVLSGTQLNGLTTANSYGDECAVATNYPIVRLRHTNTNHVTYCRAHDPSTMAIVTGSAIVTAPFEVPAGTETGPAILEVIANGNASAGVDVVVRDPIKIDFDLLPTGIVVNTQYPEATFSSQPGFENWTDAQNAGSSQPNVICTGPAGGGIDCLHDTYVDFGCPVASLTFLAVAVDGTGPVATVNVFESGTLTTSVAVEGVGDPTTPVRVDLTSFHNVTRIEMVGITDAGGIGWDDFNFCLGSSASWSNYGVGYPGTLGIPTLTASNDPVLGTPITIDIGNSLGSPTPAILIIGLAEASIPTSAGGTLLVDPLLITPIALSGTGLSLSGGIPSDPALCGFSIFLQAIELDSGALHGLSFTAGNKLVLGY